MNQSGDSALSFLITTVDDTIAIIGSLLEDSEQARSNYKSKWNKIIESYDSDLLRLEDEITALNRVEKKQKSALNPSNHALNFHIQRAQKGKHDLDIFELPPNNVLCSESDDEMSRGSSSVVPKAHGSSQNRLQMEQEKKYKLRESMLKKCDKIRENEIELEQQLEKKVGNPDMIQATLEKYQKEYSRHVALMVSSYKPKNVGKKQDKLNRSLLGVQSIDHILQGIGKGRGAFLPQPKFSNGDQRKHLSTQVANHARGGNDKNMCEMIMNDDEQFYSLENLPFRPNEKKKCSLQGEEILDENNFNSVERNSVKKIISDEINYSDSSDFYESDYEESSSEDGDDFQK